MIPGIRHRALEVYYYYIVTKRQCDFEPFTYFFNENLKKSYIHNLNVSHSLDMIGLQSETNNY